MAVKLPVPYRSTFQIKKYGTGMANADPVFARKIYGRTRNTVRCTALVHIRMTSINGTRNYY